MGGEPDQTRSARRSSGGPGRTTVAAPVRSGYTGGMQRAGRAEITRWTTGGVLGLVLLAGCASSSAATPADSSTAPTQTAAAASSEALESLELTRVLPTTAQTLYAAWLDGEQHAAFTGSPATGEAKVGSRHTAWNGYISGEILELTPGERIVMSWRTQQFPEGAADSRVELRFVDTDQGVELTIVHTDIPAGQGTMYEEGWDGHYFQPIEQHYGSSGATSP